MKTFDVELKAYLVTTIEAESFDDAKAKVEAMKVQEQLDTMSGVEANLDDNYCIVTDVATGYEESY